MAPRRRCRPLQRWLMAQHARKKGRGSVRNSTRRRRVMAGRQLRPARGGDQAQAPRRGSPLAAAKDWRLAGTPAELQRTHGAARRSRALPHAHMLPAYPHALPTHRHAFPAPPMHAPRPLASALATAPAAGAKRTSSAAAGRQTIRYAVIGLGYIAQVAVLPAFRNAFQQQHPRGARFRRPTEAEGARQSLRRAAHLHVRQSGPALPQR